MSEENAPVKFQAIIKKLQTLEGGGWRVTLDAADDDLAHFARMLALKDELLTVAVLDQNAKVARSGSVQ